MKEHDSVALKDIVEKDVFLFALHIDANVTINGTKYTVRNRYFHRQLEGGYILDVSFNNPRNHLRLSTDKPVSKTTLLMCAKNGDFIYFEENSVPGRPAGYYRFGAMSGTINEGVYELNPFMMFPEFP